ncbi:MAG: 30S ribosomal protein S3, partial [Candidatus Omnitrophica bacterium]|nr:30S ribosomal protein S3 [Candidatus Omnitrophota bacterium]
MGQKVNPIGLRIGIVENWRSMWFASKKEFRNLLKEDILIRDYIKKRYPRGTISKIEIEKTDKIRIKIYTPRPGVVLGRKGAEINQLRDELYEIFKKQITIDCIEINQPG